MPYDSSKHNRQSMRLRGYDYAQSGAYFVTVCTQHRQCLFGEVDEGMMVLNEAGQIVAEEWLRSEIIREEITLDAFVIMPNHMHGIVVIDAGDTGGATGPSSKYNHDGTDGDGVVVGATGPSPLPRDEPTSPPDPTIRSRSSILPNDQRPGPPPRSLGALMAGFKGITTKRINRLRQTVGARVWQRNYHDHIIRHERAWHRIRQYIEANPARCADDTYYAP
ncbi:MAG: hypothetical protein GVY15_03430 [Bacteroidetes bacterium]|jgi:REP element-mobilizing transposase RayT|nr:hypothetical protein [Bacteroidota bacterium]